jgi:hypothetical protein
LGVSFVLVFPGNIAQYLDHKDAWALNSDNSRLIRLFFQPVLLLGPGQQVRLKPGETTKLKLMNDAQLKLSSQICFPLYSASRLITKAYKPI